jgi:hypothetical protein
MENPATWGPAERIIDKVYEEWWDDIQQDICGWSLPMRITTALREAGLLPRET